VSIESKDELEPGTYIALVEIDWKQDLIKEFVLCTYSRTNEISLAEVKDEEYPNFLEETLKSCARQKT